MKNRVVENQDVQLFEKMSVEKPRLRSEHIPSCGSQMSQDIWGLSMQMDVGNKSKRVSGYMIHFI